MPFSEFGIRGAFTSITFTLVPIIVIIYIGITLVRIISIDIKNSKSPVLSVTAKVVSKRMQINRRRNISEPVYFHSSTVYYTTFEVESGDRIEFRIPNNEYGFLVEQDTGKLTFKGSKFIEFERNKNL